VSQTLANRLDAAIEYMGQNPEAEVILSGGKGAQEKISEAEAMRNYFVDHEVSMNRVYMEGAATSTAENFAYALSYTNLILGEDPADQSIAFITSKYHVYRAERTAERAGIAATHIGTNVPWYAIIPNFLREDIAVLRMWIVPEASAEIPDMTKTGEVDEDMVAALAKSTRTILDLQKALGVDALFTRYCPMVLDKEGRFSKRAAKSVHASMTEQIAQYWYAVENGYALSDEEYEEMEQEWGFSSFAGDADTEVINPTGDALREYGITEEDVWASYGNENRLSWTISKMWAGEEREFKMRSGNVLVMEKELRDFRSDKEKEILRVFKKSDAYDVLRTAMKQWDAYIKKHDDVPASVQAGDVPDALRITLADLEPE